MYLSRIELNRRRRETVNAQISPQLLHAAIEACFPSEDEAGARTLWRLDGMNRSLYLLLQSEGKPDFTHIVEQFGWAGQSWETKEYDGFLSRLQKDQLWKFRLRANPTRSVSREERARGKVVPYTTPDRQRQWLIDRAAKCGFEIVRFPSRRTGGPGAEAAPPRDEDRAFGVTQRETMRFWRQGALVTVEAAVFEGDLRILDAESLTRAMRNGIGRAKAYGCGLLTLAPWI
ncbi:MAG: type I-E CRISPR-associated protein Cas6/Cse3/CasE [Clostridiales Family XIII bacterium]|jgi:CRISPR system Cascade subunit CasE|nr:type I-E CRISPR-associated protein Cas6/Cse3/CasE [Clostridiales Family XIII bacterium]